MDYIIYYYRLMYTIKIMYIVFLVTFEVCCSPICFMTGVTPHMLAFDCSKAKQLIDLLQP